MTLPLKFFSSPWLFSLLLLLFPFGSSHQASAATEVSRADQLRKSVGLDRHACDFKERIVKVAVLDNGFAGYTAGSSLLPQSAELIEGPQNKQAPTNHGLGMAQIVWALTGKNAQGPKFYLVNANGFTNFKAAIDFVIEKKVDIVLYSQVWPFGSNFDGKGFINAAVNRATSAGILWINAAGNHGGQVYNGVVNALPRKKDLRFTNLLDENQVTLTLSWTDFQETEDAASAKDLDIFVYDSKGKLVGSSELIQRGESPQGAATSGPALSSYPRETLVLNNLERGDYSIRVKAKETSQKFGVGDRFRVLLNFEKPGSVDFKDRSELGEIMAPADNETVLTVGELADTSAIGPTSDQRTKPDVVLESSTVSFTNGNQTSGTSNAAAIFAGVMAVLKCEKSDIGFKAVKAYADLFSSANALSLRGLKRVPLSEVPQNVLALLPPRSWVTRHWAGGMADSSVKSTNDDSARYVIVMADDPLDLPEFRQAGVQRSRPTDILLGSLSDRRYTSVPVEVSNEIRSPWVEFRQAKERRTWQTPAARDL